MARDELDYRHYDRKVVEELEAEIERLRSKLSPLEDKSFTALFKQTMYHYWAGDIFTKAEFQGVEHYWADPPNLWYFVLDAAPNIHDITKLGRTLRALGWVQTAKDGKRYYIIPVSEYHEQIR